MPDYRVVTHVNWLRSDEAKAHPMMDRFVPFSGVMRSETHEVFRSVLKILDLPHVVRLPINGDSIVGAAQRVLSLEGTVGHFTLYYEGSSEDGGECLIGAFDNEVDAVLARLSFG